MPRYTKPKQIEPVYITKIVPMGSDDEWIYEDVYFSDGGVSHNKAPVRPEVPKEVLLERAADILIAAWFKAQARIIRETEALAEAPVPNQLAG